MYKYYYSFKKFKTYFNLEDRNNKSRQLVYTVKMNNLGRKKKARTNYLERVNRTIGFC